MDLGDFFPARLRAHEASLRDGGARVQALWNCALHESGHAVSLAAGYGVVVPRKVIVSDGLWIPELQGSKGKVVGSMPELQLQSESELPRSAIVCASGPIAEARDCEAWPEAAENFEHWDETDREDFYYCTERLAVDADRFFRLSCEFVDRAWDAIRSLAESLFERATVVEIDDAEARLALAQGGFVDPPPEVVRRARKGAYGSISFQEVLQLVGYPRLAELERPYIERLLREPRVRLHRGNR